MTKSLVELGEFVEIVMGQAPPGAMCNKDGIGTVFVKAGEFQERIPSIREWTTRPLKMAEPGDSLLCVVGATAGKVNYSAFDCAIGRSVSAIRPQQGRIDSLFLYHFLRTRVEQLRDRSQGAAQGVITREMIQSLRLIIPPLNEQRNIAAILDKADALRTKRREALSYLDSLAQSIFMEMFGDPTAEANSKKFQHVPLLELDMDGFQNGAYFPKENYSPDGIEMVHMSDAFGGVVERGKLRRVLCSESDLAKYTLRKSDILIARRSLTYEGAAKPCLIPESSEPLIFESSFIRIRPDLSRISTTFLFHYLKNNRVRERFVSPFVTQSTISGINQANLAKVPVLLPPISLQHSFEAKILALEILRDAHQNSAIEFERFFNSLQSNAFLGKL